MLSFRTGPVFAISPLLPSEKRLLMGLQPVIRGRKGWKEVPTSRFDPLQDSLVEAYLNGLAWRMPRNAPQRLAQLSQNQQRLISDSGEATLRNKLIKYPELLTGVPFWTEQDDDVDAFLSLLKPFRDSLCHPSPFEAPQKFGGYDKLSKVYGLTRDTFEVGATVTMSLIDRIHRHVDGAKEPPHWMSPRVEKKPPPATGAAVP